MNLMELMLTFDPRSRISAEKSLEHPYFSAYHNVHDEPNNPTLFDFSFESANTIAQIKSFYFHFFHY